MIQARKEHSENRKLGADAFSVKTMFIFFTQFLGRVHFREQCIFSFLFGNSQVAIK